MRIRGRDVADRIRIIIVPDAGLVSIRIGFPHPTTIPITRKIASWENRTVRQQYNREIIGRNLMAQKVIDVVGTSKESFAKAAENAVAEAAKTVRGLKWARVAELEMELEGKKIIQYRTTTKIYFDIEH